MPYAWYLYGAKIEWSSLFEFAVQLTANYVKKEVLVTQVIRFNFFILTFGFNWEVKSYSGFPVLTLNS